MQLKASVGVQWIFLSYLRLVNMVSVHSWSSVMIGRYQQVWKWAAWKGYNATSVCCLLICYQYNDRSQK
jgi:hypothetical protein